MRGRSKDIDGGNAFCNGRNQLGECRRNRGDISCGVDSWQAELRHGVGITTLRPFLGFGARKQSS